MDDNELDILNVMKNYRNENIYDEFFEDCYQVLLKKI